MAAEPVPDGTYPGMWRVQHSNGSLSDMFNRARAGEYLLSLLPRKGPAKTEALAVLAKKTKATQAVNAHANVKGMKPLFRSQAERPAM